MKNIKNNSIIVKGSIMLLLCLTITSQAKIKASSPENATSPFLEVNKAKMFSPYIALESWGTYSIGEEKNDEEYADRADASFRRLRFGASGAPYARLKYSFQFQIDRLGEDPYASTKGSCTGLNVWNAYITAKLLKNSELINLEAGYFWAAISREYMTCPWAVGSFDKARACWYMRNFVTGTGNGIESGIALGGLKNFENFGINYRIGTYEPGAYKSSKYASRLYTGRLMLSLGDPEQKSYKYMLSGNQWRKRKGITLGLGGSTQANGALTDSTYFDQSSAYGGDILINYGGLRIDAEYFLMRRTAEQLADYDGTQWHIRVGYSFLLAGKYIEPVIAYDKYEGEGAKAQYKYIGDDKTFDLGVNWYINKDKLKLALHYVIQDGSISPNTGDYLGIACQFKL